VKRGAHALVVAIYLILAGSIADRVQASAPPGRYTVDSTKGTVADLKTGLVWQMKNPAGTYTLDGAKTYCAGVGATLGGTGWRVPSVMELQTLVDDRVAQPGPTIDQIYFPSTPGDWFWSSTPSSLSVSSSAWRVDFSSGISDLIGKTSPSYVRCVR